MYRFCSEFTKHELKLQAFLLSQNTQGEENSEVDEDLHIVEEIKKIVEIKKRSWKLRVKWQGSDDETDELLTNLKTHEDCGFLLQPVFDHFLLHYLASFNSTDFNLHRLSLES